MKNSCPKPPADQALRQMPRDKTMPSVIRQLVWLGLVGIVAACASDGEPVSPGSDAGTGAAGGSDAGTAGSGGDDTATCACDNDGNDELYEPCDDGNDTSLDTCTTSCTWNTESVGSPCRCEDAGCEIIGIPMPAGGTIIGCEQMVEWPHAVTACLRGYEGGMAPKFWAVNGYCALLALDCEGNTEVCGEVVQGDFDQLVSCPEGTVLARWRTESMGAIIHTKLCLAECQTDCDCRYRESDEVTGAVGQFGCVDSPWGKFCYDPRNLDGLLDLDGGVL